MYRVQTVFTGTPVSEGLSTVFYDASASTPGEAVTAHAGMLDAMTGFIHQFQDYTVSGTVDLIDETTGGLVDSTSGPDFPVNTVNTAEPLPAATQLLVRLETGVVVAGRRLRGRMFLPGFTEIATNNSGGVLASFITATNGFLEDWATLGTARPVVWHRPKPPPGGVGPDTPGSFSQVVGATLWNQWAVLRQRRPEL